MQEQYLCQSHAFRVDSKVKFKGTSQFIDKNATDKF